MTAFLLISLMLFTGCGNIQDSQDPPTLPPPQAVTLPPSTTQSSDQQGQEDPTQTKSGPVATATLPRTSTPEITPTVEITLDVPAAIAPQVTIAAGQPTLNHDLLFIAGRALQIRNARSAGITTLLDPGSESGINAFSVTADGERLVASRLLDAENRTFELIRVDIQNVRTWKLADAPHLLHFAVSPDGRYALFVAGGRPFEPSEPVAELEADNPNFQGQAGTVFFADMETQQSREVGQCVDIPEGADWGPERLVSCQGVYWTNDSQNMLWADVHGIWIRHLDASQPDLAFPNTEATDQPPGTHIRPMKFAKNGRHLLVQRIFFEGFTYEVIDLVTEEIIEIPGSQFGIDTGYINVGWMQDDRLFKLRQRDEDGRITPALELWRIQNDNSIQLEETTELTNLPDHQNIRFVEHFQNGRFGFLLEANDPVESGLYIMASSTEQPERINGLPFNQNSIYWQPDGSGAMVEQRDAIGNFLYTPAGGNVYYDLRPTFGPNPRAFFWRP